MSEEEQDHQHMEAKREVQGLEREMAAIDRKLNSLLPKAEAALRAIQFANAYDRLQKWAEVDPEEMGRLIQEGADVQRRLDKAQELLRAFG